MSLQDMQRQINSLERVVADLDMRVSALVDNINALRAQKVTTLHLPKRKAVEEGADAA